MHCLEVIEARNDRAAGREAGHAKDDEKYVKHDRILTACQPHSEAFVDAYLND